MIVVLPLSVRIAEPFWLMICPPARFLIVVVKLELTVLENTASELAPVTTILPELIN